MGKDQQRGGPRSAEIPFDPPAEFARQRLRDLRPAARLRIRGGAVVPHPAVDGAVPRGERHFDRAFAIAQSMPRRIADEFGDDHPDAPALLGLERDRSLHQGEGDAPLGEPGANDRAASPRR